MVCGSDGGRVTQWCVLVECVSEGGRVTKWCVVVTGGG